MRGSRRHVTTGILLWLHQRVLLVVVATGNHFFFGAAAGGITVALAAGATFLITRSSIPDQLARLPERPQKRCESEKLAA